MPFDGDGVFDPLSPPTYPPEAGQLIESQKFIDVINDILEGLSQTWTRDGQATPSQNMPMGGFKFTGVAEATATGQFLRWGQAAIVVTPLDNGGVGDGVTNDYTALTATITAAKARVTALTKSRIVIDLCGRVYVVKTPLLHDGTGIDIVNGTILAGGVSFTAAKYALRLTGSDIRVHNVVVDCAGLGSGIDVRGQNIVIERCAVRNMVASGIGIDIPGGTSAKEITLKQTIVEQFLSSDTTFLTQANLTARGVNIGRPDVDLVDCHLRYCLHPLYIEGTGANVKVRGGSLSQNPLGLASRVNPNLCWIEEDAEGIVFNGVLFDSGRTSCYSDDVSFVGNIASVVASGVTLTFFIALYAPAGSGGTANPTRFESVGWQVSAATLALPSIGFLVFSSSFPWAGSYTHINSADVKPIMMNGAWWVKGAANDVPILTLFAPNQGGTGVRVALVDAATTDPDDAAYFRSAGDYMITHRHRKIVRTVGDVGSLELSHDDCGKIILCVNTGADLTLSFDDTLPPGWHCEIVRYTGDDVFFTEAAGAGADILTPGVAVSDPWSITMQNGVVRARCASNADDVSAFIILDGHVSP